MITRRKPLTKSTEVVTTPEPYGWPPVCCGLFYQPKMPSRNDHETSPDSKHKLDYEGQRKT